MDAEAALREIAGELLVLDDAFDLRGLAKGLECGRFLFAVEASRVMVHCLDIAREALGEEE